MFEMKFGVICKDFGSNCPLKSSVVPAEEYRIAGLSARPRRSVAVRARLQDLHHGPDRSGISVTAVLANQLPPEASRVEAVFTRRGREDFHQTLRVVGARLQCSVRYNFCGLWSIRFWKDSSTDGPRRRAELVAILARWAGLYPREL